MIKTSYKDIDRYEDIGGKTDFSDSDELDTVSREVNEETNLIISEQIIKQQLYNSKCIYIPHGKYILYFIHANSYESGLTKECFGDKELHDNIPRTIDWVNIENLINNKLNIHPRLCANEFKDALKEIHKTIDNQSIAVL
jgi:8-oxo-dGTP pyrophosphatase MutT (NUDIX family)